MKKIIITTFAALLMIGFSTEVSAQDKPAPSPLGKVYQRVGVTDVEITYSRPGVKGRTVFGDLVPYGKVWRTGANRPTKISVSTDVTIGGAKLSKGEYSIFTVPGETEWEVMINTELNSAGKFDKANNVASFKVTPSSWDTTIETFTIGINNVKDTSAEIMLLWENAIVAFGLEVDKTW